MKLKGKITLLINREETIIELMDEDSWVTFARVRLTPDQFSSALSRMVHTNCDIEVTGLNVLGKTQEVSKLEFKIPNELNKSNKNQLVKIAQSILDKDQNGWIAENYFNSQDSFREINGVKYAKCTIRRWI